MRALEGATLLVGCILWGAAMPDILSSAVVGFVWGLAVASFFSANMHAV